MVAKDELEKIYIRNLEVNLIKHLAYLLQIDNRKAMDIYYTSNLCEQIHQGLYGIQYMDYKYLAEDLIENELNKKK